MCETRLCPHEAETLCTCKAIKERDKDIIGLFIHIHENMKDVEWELDYTDLSRPEKRRLCLVGKCRVCGGRLCQELDASDELAGDDLLAAIYRHLYQIHNAGGRYMPRQEFRDRFIRMFHEADRAFICEWLDRPENQHVSRMYRRIVKPAAQEEKAGVTVYTIIRTGVDVDHGSFPGPSAEGSFFSLLRAKKELQRLVCAEKEDLDGRYDYEELDEDHWEMYQDGNAAALFVRLEIVPSELILMSDGEKEEVEGSLEEEAEAKECLSRMWHMRSDHVERDRDGEHH